MPQTLTTTQIQQYIDSIKVGGLNQARLAYTALTTQGYNYAGWAAGVASGSSITGLSALSYLRGTALIGMGSDACRNLTQTQIDKIRVDMATGYLETLKAISIKGGGTVNRDIGYKEAEKFHQQAFENNSLTLDNWTLKTPMDLITQTQGADAAEKIWEHLRDTGGSGLDAIRDSTLLLTRVGKLMSSTDPDIAARAQQWMDLVPGPANWGQIKRFLDIYGSQFNGINDISYNPMGDAITISPTLGTTPDPLVKVIQYVDPLVLDLDGDGLEITPLSKGILFDANGDTLKTGTAWVGADDGLLVWDRNGNGTIDTGAELFGDETVLANGKKAAHGFAALSELDTGSVINGATVGAGDGVFDAQDAKYSTLRIWRDLNQDGISQANELKTLAETGLASIKLGSSASNANYGDAVLAQSSSFTRSNGSTGQAGSFILAQNNFSREFAPIVVRDVMQCNVLYKQKLRNAVWI